ncbi:unnamed protein product [Discosporangium mesarthrocarpum]
MSAEGWITEVSMEIEGETEPASSVPVRPPPPPPDVHPFPQAPVQSSGSVSTAPYYQDQHGSFSQFSYEHQWAGYHQQQQYPAYYGYPSTYSTGTYQNQQYPPAYAHGAYGAYPGYYYQQFPPHHDGTTHYGAAPGGQPMPPMLPPTPEGQVPAEVPPPPQAHSPPSSHMPPLPPPLPMQPPPPLPPPTSPSHRAHTPQVSSSSQGDSLVTPTCTQPTTTENPHTGDLVATSSTWEHNPPPKKSEGKTLGYRPNPKRFQGQWDTKEPENGRGGQKDGDHKENGKEEKSKAQVKKGRDKHWPLSLRNYLKRAFGEVDGNTSQQTEVETALQAVLQEAIAANSIWKTDWDSKPLPSCCRLASGKADHKTNRKPSPENDRKRSHGQVSRNSRSDRERREESRSPQVSDADQERREQRRRRFKRCNIPPPMQAVQARSPAVYDNGMVNIDAITVKGTSTELEKDYLRLTQAPDPSTVRPQHVLEKAIELLQAKWGRHEVDYIYTCSQLKAIRQDLVVQRIKNPFTVQVYEAHARIALQQGDLNEYNQCQTQLKELYSSGLQGQKEEFTAYRILYYIYLQTTQTYAEGSKDILKILQELPPGPRGDTPVGHALRVREAMSLTDYHMFFSLCKTVPNLGGYIVKRLVDTVRVTALQRIIKAYRPMVPVAFVLRELMFSPEEDGHVFLAKCGVSFTEDGDINCKASSVNQGGLTSDKPNTLL